MLVGNRLREVLRSLGMGEETRAFLQLQRRFPPNKREVWICHLCLCLIKIWPSLDTRKQQGRWLFDLKWATNHRDAHRVWSCNLTFVGEVCCRTADIPARLVRLFCFIFSPTLNSLSCAARLSKSCPSQKLPNFPSSTPPKKNAATEHQQEASEAWTLVATRTAFMDFGVGMWQYDLWWCGKQLWTGAPKQQLKEWETGKEGLKMWRGWCWQMRRMGRSESCRIEVLLRDSICEVSSSSLHYLWIVLNLKPIAV